MTTHWKNVRVSILYQWSDGTLKLVSKAPHLHQGTLLGNMMTADVYSIQAENGGHSSFCSFAGVLKQVYETAGLTEYL